MGTRVADKPGGGVWSRVVSVILTLAILGTLGTLGYVIANPAGGEKFTEFYLMDLKGGITDYPEQLGVGEEGKVTVGIINREGEEATYRVEVVINGAKSTEVESIRLEDGEKWEEIVGFIPDRVVDKQKVEFLLYRQGQNEVCQRLHLWVDVR